MNKNPEEGLGEQFNLEDYLQAQEKTRQVVLAFSKLLKPGIDEVEAKALLEKTLDESGLEKRWHPSKMRIGPNTTKNFRDDSLPHVLTENDIFFVDIGPVYYNHEGDYGETFTLGSDSRLKKLAVASKTIFNSTLKVWKENKLTGIELYKFAELEAVKLNLKLNSNMYGHRMGDFPHAVHSRAKLGSLDFSPSPQLWILEIHVIDEELGLGSFFEDLLI
jgi:Xaa-Pro aminopeptidase